MLKLLDFPKCTKATFWHVIQKGARGNVGNVTVYETIITGIIINRLV